MLIHGDCLKRLKALSSNSIDSVVTDPPYGISFMGKSWDYDIPCKEIWEEVLRVLKPGGHALVACGTKTQHKMASNLENAGFEIRDVIAWVYASSLPKGLNIGKVLKGARKWEGWHTSLKPSMELWTLCRKPMSIKPVYKNILQHGTGGLNVGKCRVGGKSGRYPSNFIHDGSKEVLDLLPYSKSSDAVRHNNARKDTLIFGDFNATDTHGYNDAGSAARFFYSAKASKNEKNKGLKTDCTHPTVKPVSLMCYLCRLITPDKGIILDPFMGSGSTGIAAKLEGFKFIGIEKEKGYCKIAKARIASWK